MALLRPVVRRFEDLPILYDFDVPGRSRPIRQRVYKSEDESIQTPITPLLLAKRYTGSARPPRAMQVEPRHVLACFNNPDNVGGITELQAIVPYAPFNPLHKLHVREILNYNGVASGFYYGESHSINIGLFYVIG